MDEELKQLLDKVLANREVASKAHAVQTAAQTPVPDASDESRQNPAVESKGLTRHDLDAQYEDPLRKNFERLAKAAPSQFGHLGARTVLDDPYSFLREKRADGSYKVKAAELDAIIKSMLALNGGGKEAIANGATALGDWAAQSGNPEAAIAGVFEQAVASRSFGGLTNEVRKAVDSSSGAALIRTDIEPVLREAFNRVFPAYDLFPKIPANGIKHTWNQVTSPGTAALLGELGDFSGTATNNSYSQTQSTNIAVIASQREIGLKAQLASQQSGMNFNLGGGRNTEVMGALTAIANVAQGQMFQGNEAVASKTVDDEDGLTNALGFTGFRQQLKSASYSINKGAGTYLAALRSAVGQLFDAGADMSEVAVFLSVGANNALDTELETFYRYMKSESDQATPVNFSAPGLSMLNGILARIKPVPSGGQQANGIGYYTLATVATEDIYVLDPNGTKLPYIGSPTPTILELPTGWGNHLSNTFVPFLMIGLAIYVKLFNRKIRIAKTTI